MIVLDLWQLSHPVAPGSTSQGTLAQCEEWRARDPLRTGGEGYVIKRVRACGCCGRHTLNGSMSDSITTYSNGATRCADHHGRNPCAIEGCRRTREAPAGTHGPYHADDQTICAEHWKRYVPPRSRMRRAYHAHFRRAKRLDWDEARERAFWRFWTTLVAVARRRSQEGHLDKAEIDRIMGWD